MVTDCRIIDTGLGNSGANRFICGKSVMTRRDAARGGPGFFTVQFQAFSSDYPVWGSVFVKKTDTARPSGVLGISAEAERWGRTPDWA